VGLFNVNGLGWEDGRGVVMPKWEYICDFIGGCTLCGLNETRGTNVGRLERELPEYSVFSSCEVCDKGGQGVALFVHNSVRNLVRLWRMSKAMQLIWVRVTGSVLGVSEEVMLGVVYIPPITNERGEEELAQFYITLACEIEEAKEVCQNVFLMGDFNAHLGRMSEHHGVFWEVASTWPREFVKRTCTTKSDSVNVGGRLLLEAVNRTELLISTGRGRGDVGQPTCKGVTRTEHFVMSASVFSVFKRVVTPDYPVQEFDHSPIQIFFPPLSQGGNGGAHKQCDRHVCDRTCRNQWRLVWKDVMRQEYADAIEGNTELRSQFDQAVGEGRVDLAASLLTSIVHGAALEDSVGMFRSVKCAKLRQQYEGRRRRFPAWFDERCRATRWELKKALASGVALHLYRARKREYRHLLRRAHRRHTKYRQALFLDRLARQDVDAIKMLREREPRKASPISTESWRDYIARHFCASGETPPSPHKGEGAGPSVQAVESLYVVPGEERICALAEKYARNLKLDTSAGFDGLLAPFVKCAVFKWGHKPDEQRHVLAPLLGRLFHMMLTRGVAPEAWKAARLSPIHKKDDVCDPNNYRMLAVNGVLYRVYANVVRELLTEWSIGAGAVPDTQFAFYPGRNAQQPMFILRHLIHSTRCRGGARGKNLFTAFVDFTQAYDHIDRERMWDHFRNKLDMPGTLLEAVRALYTGDAYILCDGPKQTPAIHPSKGVKQGCPLSPLLFALYVSDVGSVFDGCEDDEAKGGVRITWETATATTVEAVAAAAAAAQERAAEREVVCRLVTHLLYADDLVLLATNARAMQKLLDSLKGYADRKGLTVNARKTQVVVFNGRPFEGQLVYGDQLLEVKHKFKYLGMWFSRETKRVRNMQKAAADAWCAPLMGAMTDVLRTARSVGVHQMPHALLRLFQTYALSRGMYACQIWGTAYMHPDSIYKAGIQVRHLGFLRRVLGVRRTAPNDVIMSETCQTPFQFYWIRSICRFWNGMCEANSELLRDVARADVFLSRECDRCWCAEVRDATEAYPLLGEHASVCMNGMNMMDVAKVSNAWWSWYESRWQRVTGDPRDPELSNRQLGTYNAYFRREGRANWWHMAAHLRAETSLTPDVVRNVSRFRVGSHNLGVERARYQYGVRIPRHERRCARCTALGVQQPQVDDEKHLVFECPYFHFLRTSRTYSPLFQEAGSDVQKFMRNSDFVKVAQFIDQCMRCVDQWGARDWGAPADQP